MTLFRYLLRSILGRLALAVPALALVYLGFDLGDEGRRLAARLGWSPVLHAALLHLPLICVQVLPAAVLIASLLALARLRQAGELEAVAAAGAGPRFALWPLLATGLLAAGSALLLGELAVPRCEQRADELLGARRASPITGEGSPSGWLRQGRWFLRLTPLADGRTALSGLEHDGAYRATRTLEGELSRTGRLGAQLRAVGGPAAAGPPPVLHLAPAGEAGELHARPEALSRAALRRRVRLLRESGRARPAEELLLHARWTFPSLSLLVALLAWPFALRPRQRSFSLDLCEGVLWLMGLWAALALGWLAARAGWLPPLAGAWLPLVGVGLLAAAAAALRRAARRSPA